MELIAIEGLDGAGKATVATSLKERLEIMGYKVEIVAFPRYDTPYGKVIFEMMNSTYMELNDVDTDLTGAPYTLDRIAYFKENLQRLNDEGVDYLIMDRSFYSNFMYHACKLKSDKEIADWLVTNYTREFIYTGIANRIHFGMDYNLNTYVLMMDEETALRRRKEREAQRALDGLEQSHDYQMEVSDFTQRALMSSAEEFVEGDTAEGIAEAGVDALYQYENSERLREDYCEILENAVAVYYYSAEGIEVKHAETPEEISKCTADTVDRILFSQWGYCIDDMAEEIYAARNTQVARKETGL